MKPDTDFSPFNGAFFQTPLKRFKDAKMIPASIVNFNLAM